MAQTIQDSHSRHHDHDDHGHDHAPHDWKKHKKSYWIVFGLLCLCTLITVALGLVDFFDIGVPGPDSWDFVLGLTVALTKASLVGLIFMHLNHEKGLIYKMLLFTVIFCIGLVGLTLFAGCDPIKEEYDTYNTTGGKLLEKL